MATQREKGEAFQALHEGDAFVLPNAWAAGSARGLAELGFPALASTSGGFAQALGRSDGEVGLDETIEHARELDRATELPVSIDLENGYGPDPADAARAISGVAAAGAVGGSIEDWDRDGGYLYDTEHAAERVVAAAEAARSLDIPLTLTPRAEKHHRDRQERRRGDEAEGGARERRLGRYICRYGDHC